MGFTCTDQLSAQRTFCCRKREAMMLEEAVRRLTVQNAKMQLNALLRPLRLH